MATLGNGTVTAKMTKVTRTGEDNLRNRGMEMVLASDSTGVEALEG